MSRLLGFLAPVDSRDEEAEKTAVVQAWPLPAFFFFFSCPYSRFWKLVGEEHLFLLREKDSIEVSHLAVWRSVVGWGRNWRQEKIQSYQL